MCLGFIVTVIFFICFSITMMNMSGQGGGMNMNLATAGASMTIMDEMSEPSSPESATFEDTDLISSAIHDDVSAQLAAAGRGHTVKSCKCIFFKST